jgi:hypothetical protein
MYRSPRHKKNGFLVPDICWWAREGVARNMHASFSEQNKLWSTHGLCKPIRGLRTTISLRLEVN